MVTGLAWAGDDHTGLAATALACSGPLRWIPDRPTSC
jgi:hypothetical protein